MLATLHVSVQPVEFLNSVLLPGVRQTPGWILHEPELAGATAQEAEVASVAVVKPPVQLHAPPLQVPWPLQSLSSRHGSGHTWPAEPPEMHDSFSVTPFPLVKRLHLPVSER